MKFHTHHFVLISIIGILAVISFAIFQSMANSTTVSADTKGIYMNGAKISEIDDSTLIETPTAIATTSASSTQEMASTTIEEVQIKNDFAPVSILHFGDTMFDRNVRKRMAAGVDVFSSLHSLNIMDDYDIRMLNLEGPIVEMPRDKCQQKAYNFQFATNTAWALLDEGFNTVTIANNHTFDCYQKGVDSTFNYLKEAKMNIIGYPTLDKSYKEIVTEDGTSVAMIGFDTTISVLQSSKIISLIKELKLRNDVVIVSVHFGVEYEIRANLEQKSLAHSLIKAGADLIIGNHPHVIQNMEIYNGKVIFYSLGNFIFDQIGDKENKGMGVGIKLFKDSTDVMIFPYDIINSTPTFKSMQEANEWCKNYYGVTPYVTSEGCSARITN